MLLPLSSNVHTQEQYLDLLNALVELSELEEELVYGFMVQFLYVGVFGDVHLFTKKTSLAF